MCRNDISIFGIIDQLLSMPSSKQRTLLAPNNRAVTDSYIYYLRSTRSVLESRRNTNSTEVCRGLPHSSQPNAGTQSTLN
jgi:hypothetical protein